MKKFVALLAKEKRPRMNGKITLTFFQLYILYKKNYDNSFSILYSLTSLNNQFCYKLQIFELVNK